MTEYDEKSKLEVDAQFAENELVEEWRWSNLLHLKKNAVF